MNRAAVMLALLAAMLPAQQALGDGGAVLARMEVGDSALVVFVAPVPPGAGEVELSFLLSNAGKSDATTPISFTATGPSGAERSGVIESGREADRLARSALIELTEGEWIVDAQVRGDPAMRVRVAIAVGPAPPPWQSSLPWMLAWIPVAALIVIRERLVRGRRAGQGYP